jgi:hypothetical protein
MAVAQTLLRKSVYRQIATATSVIITKLKKVALRRVIALAHNNYTPCGYLTF